MKYPLYGNDIDETTTPLEANLEWVVKFNHSFIGRDAFFEQKASGVKKRLVGFVALDQGIPRQAYPIFIRKKSRGGYQRTLSPA